MAKTRIINTRFWVDDYVSNLDPIEKLLFLYFLTNPSTDICGVYEIPLKTIAVDTGLEVEMVKKIIRRFARDKRVYYSNGWLGIKNFIKHQSINPKVEIGINIGLEKAPREILDRLQIVYPYSISSLSHLNSNLNSNSNLKKESEAPAAPQPFVFQEYLKGMDEDKREAVQLIAHFFRERKISFDSLDQVQESIRRHIKPANKIAKAFPKNRVFDAFEKCKKQHADVDWSLDTVLKKLTN